MTYVIAWKSNSEVFLAADTAITTTTTTATTRLNLDLPESSFGQDHFLSPTGNKKVEERTTKVFLKNNIGIAFAGSYGLAINIARTFYEKINEKLSPNDALKDAIFLNQPFPKGESVQLVIGYYDSHPKLLTFNSNHDSQIRDDENIVQLGNPSNTHKDLTKSWLEDTLLKADIEPKLHLSAALGVFQSYNLFSPQMQNGIGGAFCGLYIDKSGGMWQPDILFLEYGGKREKQVSTCFRHDCFIINSATIGQSRCLLLYLETLSPDFLKSQVSKAIAKGKKLNKKAQFQYIVIFGVNKANITVIGMNRENRHECIWVENFKEGSEIGLKILLFPDLREILQNADSLTVIPYRKATIKTVPDSAKLERKINYN